MSSLAWKRTLRWAGEFLIAVALAAVIVLFVYQPVRVEGSSMMPALVDNERLFINKFLYRMGVGEVQRGDLVVFPSPNDPAKSYLKRIIGIPGDTVELRGGLVWLNGRPLEEPYVPADYRDQSNLAPVRVPPGHYFVMGDHRSASNDSRVWGPVPGAAIYGKAVFAYWPPERMGTLK
ncbi:MAG: signal peptidase I [Bryobacteraceae bacterium]|jgi:signal peptidase I